MISAEKQPHDPRPRVLGDVRRHFQLAVGMANRTGVDLQGALDAHVISHEDWANLVQRCRSCTWADGCACWLTAQDPGMAAAPDACVNAQVFDAIKDDLID